MNTAFACGDGQFNQMMSRDGRVLQGFTSVSTIISRWRTV